MRWKIKSKVKSPPVGRAGQKSKVKSEEIIKILMKNRGLKMKKQQEEFLNPPQPQDIQLADVQLSRKEIDKAIKRIMKAKEDKETVIVYGDYDTDGLCATAILWQRLNDLGIKVFPYIPDRFSEGYGMSRKGIDNINNLNKGSKLIITVDQGITGIKETAYAKGLGMEVIISDHHVLPKKLPEALAIVHTTDLSGAGIAWFLAEELERTNQGLDLAAIGTIADLVPLIKANRSLAKYGLEALKKTDRVGLLSLFKEAVLDPNKIEDWQVGFIIAPRLNAMGRLKHGLDSLRLLCTNNKQYGEYLAARLGKTNRQRQLLLEKRINHARSLYKAQQKAEKLIFIQHEEFEEGIIGLIASRLSEEFYRPSIILAKGKKFTKGSARSIKGFNIIKFLHSCRDLLVDCGGHPMAAGFTVKTARLPELQQKILAKAGELLDEKMLKKLLNIDLEIGFDHLSPSLYRQLRQLAPFGMANPEPLLMISNAKVSHVRAIGKDAGHLKLMLEDEQLKSYQAIGFHLGYLSSKIEPGQKISLAFHLDENCWNGHKSLQLKIRDIKIS